MPKNPDTFAVLTDLTLQKDHWKDGLEGHELNREGEKLFAKRRAKSTADAYKRWLDLAGDGNLVAWAIIKRSFECGIIFVVDDRKWDWDDDRYRSEWDAEVCRGFAGEYLLE